MIVSLFCESLFWASKPKQAAKTTRQINVPTAPDVLLLSPNTLPGVFDIVLAMTLRDFGKPAFSLRKLRENTCTIATGWLKNLHSAKATFPRFFSDCGNRRRELEAFARPLFYTYKPVSLEVTWGQAMESELFKLAEQLGQRLIRNGKKIATAESCTGGGIAQAITEVPGSSVWFDRGFVTYSNAAKVQMLGVSLQTLEKHGAVSAETATEMATGALTRSDADVAVAVTGIAGPEGGTSEKPVGTVFIAWADKNGKTKVVKMQFAGNRWEIRAQTVESAIEGMLL